MTDKEQKKKDDSEDGFEKNRLKAGSTKFESKEEKEKHILDLIVSKPRTPADLRELIGDSGENIRRYCKKL